MKNSPVEPNALNNDIADFFYNVAQIIDKTRSYVGRTADY